MSELYFFFFFFDLRWLLRAIHFTDFSGFLLRLNLSQDAVVMSRDDDGLPSL